MHQADEIVRSYLKAIGQGDFGGARNHLADRAFHYVSPIGAFDNADRFIENIARIGSIMQGVDIRRLFASEREVMALVDIRIALQGFVTRTAAILFQIKDGRIASMEVVFDASEYYRMFERDDEAPDAGSRG